MRKNRWHVSLAVVGMAALLAAAVVACGGASGGGGGGPIVLAGAEGLLQGPVAIQTDAAGNAYVLDSSNQVIVKVTPAGVATTLAGVKGEPGNRDGSGAAARFYFAFTSRMTLGSDGNLYLTDTCNGTVRKVSLAGEVTTVAGRKGSACNNGLPASAPAPLDGAAGDAQFPAPGLVISDGAGGFFIVDAFGATTVRSLSASGAPSTTVWSREQGSTQGPGSITSVARDAKGVLYLGDWGGRIWKIVGGTPVLVAGGSRSSPFGARADGAGAAAQFSYIAAMVMGADGNLYVGDDSMLRKVTPDGVVTTIDGSMTKGASDGAGSAAHFGFLASLALAPDGSLLALDVGQNTIRRITTAGVATTLSATPALGGYADGIGSAARLNPTDQPAADAQGNVYLADELWNVVRKVTPAGEVSLFAGVRGMPGGRDGALASATFNAPSAVAAGPGGVLYVGGRNGLRRIADGTVSTVSDTVRVWQMAVDADGSVAVSDGSAVYRFTPAGVSTVLVSADMVAAVLGKPAGTINFRPGALGFDAAGNLYVSDPGTVAVYKLGKSGKLSLFAGTPLVETGNVDGPPGTATLSYYLVDHMAIDSHGNLYLSGQGKLRKITPDGVVSTPSMAWGDSIVSGIAYGNGKLFGLTHHALLQAPVP